MGSILSGDELSVFRGTCTGCASGGASTLNGITVARASQARQKEIAGLEQQIRTLAPAQPAH
jgi:Fe-S cluster biogenesis protein NfuA